MKQARQEKEQKKTKQMNKTSIILDAYYSDQEVADILVISINTIRAWRRDDKRRPKAIKVGDLPRTSGQAIRDYLNNCAVA